MKLCFLILFGLCFFGMHCSERYILCIDGGGTKTSMHIVDMQGNIVPFLAKGVYTNIIQSSGSNINSVGIEQVRKVLVSLFEDVTLLDDGRALYDSVASCYIIASIAGLGLVENKKIVTGLFEELGIKHDRLLLAHDAELPLALIEGNGALLIAGTGSICSGKNNGKQYRVGGLGYKIAPEASGYSIGLDALKRGLEYEFGWGMPTALLPALRELYAVPELKNVMLDLYKGLVSPADVARAVPVVFMQAHMGDAQAQAIVAKAAGELSFLVNAMVMHADLFECEIHAWGGLFKSDFADYFMNVIAQNALMQERRIMFINRAHQNPAVLFAQKYLCSREDSFPTVWQKVQKIYRIF